MIIIDDGSEAQLTLPRTFGIDDMPLILQDRSFDQNGSIEYENKSLGPLDIAYGARGDAVIVNGAVAQLGTAEVWEITSIGMAHPFHIHGALFRILSLEGERPQPHLAGWKDTLLVEDKAELLIAFNQPATQAHPFMYHCHILEHEDAGLMGQYICT